MSSTQRLAAWCVETPRSWSTIALEGARRAFQDTIAAMLAGAKEPSPQALLNAEGLLSPGVSQIVGSTQRLSAPWAALVNGTGSHSQDYDDVLNPAHSHPSAALVPAILALGEELKSSGEDCLDAYLVGFEVMARLGEGFNIAHYHNGWHTTLSLGSPGVAAACARLLRLNPLQMRAAISMSTSMAGGSKSQFGTMTKHLHAGLAAKNGIVAARLAQAGVTAVDEAFDGNWGYLTMTAGADAPGLEAPLAKLGSPVAMEEFGVWLKAYPCCASAHRSIDAIRTLAPKPDEIEQISAYVSEFAAANLRYKMPENINQARFSLLYSLAATIIDGKPTPASFTDEAIKRASTSALINRIEMRIDQEQLANREIGPLRSKVVVKLRDGRIREEVVTTPFGHPAKPLSAGELDEKFLSCAAVNMAKRDGEEILGLLHELPASPSIGKIMALTASRG